MNLVLANLITSFVLIPLVFVDRYAPYLNGLCTILRGATTLTSSASILAQLLIGIDQYLAVINPLHYHRNINEWRCKLMCSITWLISFILALLCSIEFQDETEEEDGNQIFSHMIQSCKGQEGRSLYQLIVRIIYLVITFLLPILLMVGIYLQIFVAARSNSIKTRRNSSCSMTQEGVLVNHLHANTKYLTVSNNNLVRSPSTKSSNLLHLTSNLRASMHSKLSHASNLLLYGEEGRAAKITIFVLLSVAFCWIPYSVIVFYDTSYPNHTLPNWMSFGALLCSISNIAFSPILYAFRSQRVQRDVKKVFGCMTSKNVRPLCKPDSAKIRRLKSLSCPQLLISSVADNDNSTTTNTNSKTFSSSFWSEKEPMMFKPKSSLSDIRC